MIILRLYGGLGNQLFQLSAGLALSEKTKIPLFADISWYKQNPKVSLELPLALFGIKKATVFLQIFSSILLFVRRCISRLPHTLSVPCNKVIISDNRSLDNALNARIPKKVYFLDSYFQDYKYSDAVLSILSRHYKPFVCAQRRYRNDFATAIKLSNCSVAVHFRRGDYLNTNSIHNILDSSYYQKCFDLIASQVDSSISFFVFSDDPDFELDNFSMPDKCSIYYVRPLKNTSAWIDLSLMSSCDYIVTANSTYSLWAAWIHENLLMRSDPNSSSRIFYPNSSWFRNDSPTNLLNPKVTRRWIGI